MSHPNFDKLTDLWTTNPQFRRAVREDPEAALAAYGIVLTDEERQALASLDLSSLTDVELEARVSKKSAC